MKFFSEFEQTVLERMIEWVIWSVIFLMVAVVLSLAGAVLAGAVLAIVSLIFLGFGHGWETTKLKEERGGRRSLK